MERCNFFANAPYVSVEMLESVGHVTCISCFLQQDLSFFIFFILGEELEHNPQQLWSVLNFCLNSQLLQSTAAQSTMATPPETQTILKYKPIANFFSLIYLWFQGHNLVPFWAYPNDVLDLLTLLLVNKDWGFVASSYMYM